jgi:pyruvate kinase
MRTNYTKIVATLGPSSSSFSVIEEMVQAGTDVFRLNFSHGDYKEFKEMTENARKAAKKHKRIVAIMQDLQGPKIRLGELPNEGIKIKNGQKVILGGKDIPVQYKNLPKEVKKGHRIFIDDGLVQLSVSKIKGNEIHCTAKTSGTLYSNKGINTPDSQISASSITQKDIKDLEFGIKLKVDYVALSFVKSAQDIRDLRQIIKKKSGSHPKIVAKIERAEAVEKMEEIIRETDAVMVARGDLGIEIKPERIPIVQKAIIKLANRYAKPVITATQVLASMVTNPRPTRAEISDAANAIFDYTDAIMLSNETAVGKYPVSAVKVLARVISEVENEQKKHVEIFQSEIQNKDDPELNATCLSACELAVESKATKIIAHSFDGFTIRNLVRHRLFTPVIAVTPNFKLIPELSLVWGINKVLYKKFTQRELIKGNFSEKLVTTLLKVGAVNKGERVVIVYNAQNKGSIASLKV